MKLDNSSLDTEPYKHRLIWQYKSGLWDKGNPFRGSPLGYRVGIYVYADAAGKTYWNTKGDFSPSVPEEYEDEFDDANYWEQKTYSPVPRDEWFKVEIYSKVSAGVDGRFWAKINNTLIASEDGPNIGASNDTMGFTMLWQLYTNSTPAHQWLDEVEIWDGYPFPTDTD